MMAKSFKQLPTLPQLVIPEPTAGRVFLDLLNEPSVGPTAPQVIMPSPAPEPSEVIVTGNPGLPTPDSKTGELGNTAKPGKRPPKSRSADTPRATGGTAEPIGAAGGVVIESRVALPLVIFPPVEEGDTRQTFVVRRHLLEGVRDYVHARRARGDYAYSQKQALEEALLEFLAAREPAQPRPPEAREREQQFRARVREGRQSSAAVAPSARSTAQNSQDAGLS
jgi:hypothetical protein